jgi:hypothetical protein
MANIPIGIHPLCIFEPMSDHELDQLAADIKKNGLHLDIVTYESQVLDGKNRWAACKRAGVRPRFMQYAGDDPLGFVLSMDLRRHSTPEKRKEAIRRLLKDKPEKSDRKIAGQTGSDRETVGNERKKLEADGEIPAAQTREGTDGRVQPKVQRSSEAGGGNPPLGDDDGTNDRKPKSKSHKKIGPKAPTHKCDPLNDVIGQKVPDLLRDLFGDPWLGELIAIVNEASLKIQKGSIRTKLSGKGQAHLPYLHLADALKHLDAAIENLDLLSETLIAGVPHCVCQQCGGKGCDLCRKTGWMPEWRMNELENGK